MKNGNKNEKNKTHEKPVERLARLRAKFDEAGILSKEDIAELFEVAEDWRDGLKNMIDKMDSSLFRFEAREHGEINAFNKFLARISA